MRYLLCGVLCVLALVGAPAAEPPVEVVRLPEFSDPAAWYTAECTVAAEKSVLPPGVAGGILWHTDVDWYHGEPNYPIGWPRCGIHPKKPFDWTSFDWVSFQFRADTSRQALPKTVGGFTISGPERGGESRVPLPRATGEWTTVKILLDDVAAADRIASLQWYISESDYRHEDKLDYRIADLQLGRYTAPTALSFASVERVVDTQPAYLLFDLHLVGVPRETELDGTLAVAAGSRTVAELPVKLRRGKLRLPVACAKLPAGELQAVLRVAGRELAKTTVKVVEGPFGER